MCGEGAKGLGEGLGRMMLFENRVSSNCRYVDKCSTSTKACYQYSIQFVEV